MKRLILLLALVSLSCSTDPVSNEPEEEILIVEYDYFMKLEAECLSGNGTEYEITEEIFKSIYNLNEVDDCSTYHTKIPDINNVDREGYLSGLRTQDPEYPPQS